MSKAFDVARRLIHLAVAEDEPDYLTHMRLQKLLYYVQGWSLALRSKPMFDEEIQAWAHGPVVVAVYPRFADFKDSPITPDGYPNPVLKKSDGEFVQEVWEAYKGYSASSLRAMTHRESPWKNARKGCKPADTCHTVIPHGAMRKFFAQYVKKEPDDE